MWALGDRQVQPITLVYNKYQAVSDLIMDRLHKEIHSAFYNVSTLCDSFFRKYPQYYPPQQSAYQPYPSYQYRGYSHLPSPVNINEYPPSAMNPWFDTYGNDQLNNILVNGIGQQKIDIDKMAKQTKQSRLRRNNVQPVSTGKSAATPKKMVKEEKKYEKKMQSLRQQRQRQQQQKKKAQQLSNRNRKCQRNTLKNLIKKDPRYLQKPKFPLSPYFLFLQEMRSRPSPSVKLPPPPASLNKQFAEQMGKLWRGMSQQEKKPYIQSYLKQKRIYDQQIRKFYDKYPDLKPKSLGKQDGKHMYEVDDPKYQMDDKQTDTNNNDQSSKYGGNQQQLENDLIDELHSQEQQIIMPMDNRNVDNHASNSPTKRLSSSSQKPLSFKYLNQQQQQQQQYKNTYLPQQNRHQNQDSHLEEPLHKRKSPYNEHRTSSQNCSDMMGINFVQID